MARAGALNADAGGTIGVILGARVVSRARKLVVLDGEPPFVKVYNWDGTLYRAFVRRGGAAGEAIAPSAVGILADSAVAVAELSGRISVYNLEGVLLHAQSYQPLKPLSIVGTCGDSWIVYSPSTSRLRDAITWLHIIPGDLSGKAVALLTEGRPDREELSFGKAYGVVANDTAVTVRHDFGPRPRVFTWSCRSREVVGDPLPLPKRRPTRVRASGDDILIGGDSHNLGSVGLATIEDGVILAELQTTGSEVFTTLTHRTAHTAMTVRVPGAFAIRDSRPGVGVLFQTEQPVPSVILVSEKTVLTFFDGHRR